MGDRLEQYRHKRNADRTPEPVPAEPPAGGNGPPRPGEGAAPPSRSPAIPAFVVQQHHARALHWDLRLERDGVLASWAVPRGIPRDPARNHLAVRTEDHPIEYLDFHGDIPEGEYGGGRMTIYDRGTYTTEKWRDNEVLVVLDGGRVNGRYVLFHTDGRNWMIHRMDPPEPGWTPMPDLLRPMRAEPARRLPPDDGDWAFELAWQGIRAVAYVSGGRLRLVSGETEREITASYPELRGLAETLAPTECVLDGVIVAFDRTGRISRDALHPRIAATDARAARRLSGRVPVQYLVFDVLWLDGVHLPGQPYRVRRETLDGLGVAGPHWQAPPHFPCGAKYARQASRAQGLAGVIAKRLDSAYLPGGSSRAWLAVDHGR